MKDKLSLDDVRRLLGNRIARHLRAPKIELPHEPRDYQVEALRSIGKWLRSKDGGREAYLSIATGLGKTVIFSMLAALCKDMRVLIIVPNKTLVVQTVQRLQGYVQGTLGQVSSIRQVTARGSDELLAVQGAHFDVVVSTDESFKLNPQKFKKHPPHIIIWDECHWAYTKKAWNAVSRFKDSVLIGLSATPDFLVPEQRADYHEVVLENGQSLYVAPKRMARTFFKERIADLGPVWGIKNGWLSPLAWGLVEFNVSLDEVKTVNTAAGIDYKEQDLYQLMRKHWSVMVETVCRIYKSGKPYKLKGRPAYAICPRVEMAQELAEGLNKIGVRAACIHGGTKEVERNRILSNFDSGKIKFLSSVLVLREGWDAPSAEVCWMLRPTRSRVLYMQAMGRVLRLNGKNKISLVIDPHFSGTKLAPLATPQLLLPPGMKVKAGGVIIGREGREVGGKSSILFPEGVNPKLITVQPIEIRAERSYYQSLTEAKQAAQKLGIRSAAEYARSYKKDPALPCEPNIVYSKEWKGWPEFLGTGDKFYPSLKSASIAAQRLGISTITEYRQRRKEDSRLPGSPEYVYSKDWVDWPTFLGTKNRLYPTLKEGREAARKLQIRSSRQYKLRYSEDPRLPSNPHKFYQSEWQGFAHFLGHEEKWYSTLAEASRAAQSLGISTCNEYRSGYKKDERLPSAPKEVYQDEWRGWSHFLGTGRIRPKSRADFYTRYDQAASAARQLGIGGVEEYKSRYRNDPRLPSNPHIVYKKQWRGWPDFLRKDS